MAGLYAPERYYDAQSVQFCVRVFQGLRMPASRSNRRRARTDRSEKIDLYDYAQMTPEPARPNRPVKDDLSDWGVVDDWPEDVPVTPEEVDVFERWFGDILDELFGPKDPDRA
ncbi:hypothetical protein [Algihabitans albus]|uniref:hypothetical protein n=1 Tax=Algihabitans albus TaxID=2164067 RepID=UPI001F1C1308|nr:hypothetical protein [Algihabitans albus]